MADDPDAPPPTPAEPLDAAEIEAAVDPDPEPPRTPIVQPVPVGRFGRWLRAYRELPRLLRWTTLGAIALVLLLVGGLATSYVVVRNSWPETSGELEIAALDGTVEVMRDEHGIPQIYADSLHDLVVAQGFVHAQERFYEMDIRRHVTAGRLSELFGEDALETDKVIRTLGWREVAERELTLLEPRTRDLLDAYAAGVNAYLEDRSLSELSLEYAVLDFGGLDYRPERWSAVDSIAWLKAMAWDLKGNFDDEIARALTIGEVGPERAETLFPGYDLEEHPAIVDQGGVVDDTFDQNAPGVPREPQRPAPGPDVTDDALDALAAADRAVSAVPALLGDGDGVGSNSWVVGGDRTASGAPILANDPHLGVSLPGVWMQVGLHCREVTDDCPMDVAGFSFSGVPGVIIGHNADIAWGFTNLGPDVTDLFVERVSGDEWQYDGKMRPLRLRSEVIKVRDGDAFEEVEMTVRSTSHGPLLSDIDTEFGDVFDDVEESDVVPDDDQTFGHEVAFAWTALEARPTADALLALNLATGWDEFHEAMSDFAVPGQNVVYADVDGHIGYQATGLVPIRKPGNDGSLPAAGWRPETDWTGKFVPYDALPTVVDPASGVIVTANQAVIDPETYPYLLTGDWDQGYRSRRIADLVEEAGAELTVDDLAAIQLDERNPMAPVLTPYLLAIDLAKAYVDDGQRLLETWDFQQPADSPAAAYYNVVWRQLLTRTFHDDLPEALWPDGGQRWFAAVAELLEDDNDPWWDDTATEEVETRDDILRAAMEAARDELTAKLSPDAEDWAWGDLHELRLESSTLGQSGVGLVESLFNRGGWGVGGSGSVPNATGWDAREGYGVATAPSMRMVVPMSDLDSARWINLTGVSGHAFHPHYTDQTDLFVRGETLPWVFSDDAVEGAAEDTLVLVPEHAAG